MILSLIPIPTSDLNPEMNAIFQEWSPPIFLTTATILTSAVYTLGFYAIRRTRPELFPNWRLVCFLLGMLTLWLAIGSPMDGFADSSLAAHMIEHLMLMSFVPPLVLLGNPSVPLLRGLGPVVRILAPLLRLKFLRQLGHFLINPIVAWLAMNVTFLAWHVPAAYNFALEHENWHDFEHICFLFTSILFWWPLIRPWPTSSQYNRWFMIPYLVLADIVNTALSAFLAFCDRPVYSFYLDTPNPFRISPITDQVFGAAAMWVIGSTIFLVPAMLITRRLIEQDSRLRHTRA